MPSRRRQKRDTEALPSPRRRVCLPLSFSDLRRTFRALSQKTDCVSDSILAKESSSGTAAILERIAANPLDTLHRNLEEWPCQAPTSPAPSSTTVGEALHDDDTFISLDGFVSAVLTPLRPSIFFFYAPSTAEADEDYDGPILLRAQSVETEFCGMLRLVAEDPDKQAIYAIPSDLLIDARMHCDDEPRLLSFIGARVNKGRIERVYVDSNNSVCCDVRRRCVLRGEEEILQISIEQAVEEIRTLEKQRQNAKLETYQRHICSSMMQSQRARYLGLPTQSCPF